MHAVSEQGICHVLHRCHRRGCGGLSRDHSEQNGQFQKHAESDETCPSLGMGQDQRRTALLMHERVVSKSHQSFAKAPVPDHSVTIGHNDCKTQLSILKYSESARTVNEYSVLLSLLPAI